MHSNLLHPDSSAAVPSQKKWGRASQVCFPVAHTSTGSRGTASPVLYILEAAKMVFRERRDRCWAEPYHTVLGKAEKRGHDVEQVGGKKTLRAR